MNGMSFRRNGINCTGKHQPRFYRDWENISSSPRDRYTPNMHNRLCKCYGIPTPMLSKIHCKLCYQSSGSHDQGKVYWSSYRRIVLYCYHLKQKQIMKKYIRISVLLKVDCLCIFNLKLHLCLIYFIIHN